MGTRGRINEVKLVHVVNEKSRVESESLGRKQSQRSPPTVSVEIRAKLQFAEHSHRRPRFPSATIRHDVQEAFGGIQDIRYDSERPLFITVPETIPAPLRTSDRKKLRQRVIQEFSLSSELGELLVPDGLLSVKYTSYSRVPGVRVPRVISPDSGNPF